MQDIIAQQNQSKQKLNELSERLLGIQMQQTKQPDDFYDKKLKGFNEEISRKVEQCKESFGEFKGGLLRIQDQLQALTAAKEELLTTRSRKNRQFEQNVKDYVQTELKGRKEQEKKINAYLEDKNFILSQELQKDNKVKEEELAKFTDWANGKLAGIKNEIENQYVQRQRYQENMMNSLGENIINIQEMLQTEKGRREQDQMALQKSLEQLEYDLTADLAKEKAEREHTEENILHMIEQTCSRIQTSSL